MSPRDVTGKYAVKHCGEAFTGGTVIQPLCYHTLGPGVYSASDKNEYQNQKNNISEE
jgi:hypothetical protein